MILGSSDFNAFGTAAGLYETFWICSVAFVQPMSHLWVRGLGRDLLDREVAV